MTRHAIPVDRQNSAPPPKWGRLGRALAALIVTGAAGALVKQLLQRRGETPAASPLLQFVTFVDRQVGWHRLPWPLGLPMILAFLRQLRRENLHDPSTITPSLPRPPLPPSALLKTRTAEGTFNDLAQPEMGSAGARFGRNVPLAATARDREMLSPNPRLVSRELLTRDRFLPAESLNVLTAAWIQFMIRDWFSHGKSPKDSPWQFPLADDDSWPGSERTMTILRTRDDPTRPPDDDRTPPTYANIQTHWWDASQIYGGDAGYQARARSGVDGKLLVDDNGFPAVAPDPQQPQHPADVPGFWVGVAMLHALFTREHNAICDRFREVYSAWSDEELFQHARLVNAALMAKIHTVEWTPALLDHPTMRRALRADWWGLAGERVSRRFGRLHESEIISGVVGSPTDHFSAPYALTEEFVAVYRMHPLIPDDYAFRAAADHRLLMEREFAGVAQRNAVDVLQQVPLHDLFYSFGVAHPGAITLHNFPKGLQQFQRPDGNLQDLAATDILRTRELGVPRYNAFRELIHLPRVATFEEMTDNTAWANELREVYEGDVDRVDLMVGMFAEPKPAGFAFSETAFRIFVLMAPRRLKSDRFFTTDFTPRVYTQTGLDWIADNTFGSVIARHFPALQLALHGVENAFTPWRPA